MEKPNNEQEFLVKNKQLKNINLPNIKRIGPDFLSDNPNLTNIELPEITPINHEEDSPKKGRR